MAPPTPTPYSRNRAAEVLGWSPRTLIRRSEDGVIERRPDGRFERAEVERVLALALSDDDDVDAIADGPANQALAMFRQSQGHTERMVKLLEAPIKTAIELLSSVSAAIAARDAERDTAHLDFLKAASSLFLEKSARDAMLIEATAKAETLRTVGKQLADHTPKLLTQVFGGGDGAANAVAFVQMLDDEDKVGMFAMAEFLEGQKREAYLKMLDSMGIKKPVATESVGEEAKENVS